MFMKLMINNIIRNKRKSLLAALGVMISVTLIFTTLSTYMSFQKMRLENAYEVYGRYNIIIHNISRNNMKNLVTASFATGENRRIIDVSRDFEIGTEEVMGVTETGITLIKYDDTAADMHKKRLAEGVLPQNPGETAISATAKTETGYIINNYNVGDEIMLGREIYIITGILDDYDYSTTDTYTEAVVMTETDGSYMNVYLHTEDSYTYEKTVAYIKDYLEITDDSVFCGDRKAGFAAGYTLILNDDLNRIELYGEGSIKDKNIGTWLIAAAGLLHITSVILGIHIFTAYLKERHRQQGVLLGLGYSVIYIMSGIFLECMIIVVAGCVAGTAGGVALTGILFDTVQKLRVTELSNFAPVFTTQTVLAVFAICVSGFLISLCPVMYRSMKYKLNDMNAGVIRTGIKRRVKTFKAKNVVHRYFRADNSLLEKLCIYLSMIIMGLSVVLMININRYAEKEMAEREKYDAMFELLSDDISNAEGLERLIPGLTYYDIVYDTMGEFYFDRNDINYGLSDYLMFTEDGAVLCEITGISKEQYEKKILTDTEMSYEEFVASGGVLVADNYGGGTEHIISTLPDTVRYAGRSDDVAEFEAGEADIVGRCSFLNWNSQYDITVIVPDSMFLECFDYTNVLIKINVKEGYELQAAERLNRYAGLYAYTLLDHTSEIIKIRDEHITIRVCAYGFFAFICIMNLFIVSYSYALLYARRKKNLHILRLLGYSKYCLYGYMLKEAATQILISAVFCAASLY